MPRDLKARVKRILKDAESNIKDAREAIDFAKKAGIDVSEQEAKLEKVIRRREEILTAAEE